MDLQVMVVIFSGQCGEVRGGETTLWAELVA